MKAIASKLVKIMEDCAYVQKDGTNTFHKYKYASAANVLEKVNESCVKHNVASIATTEIVSTMDRTTSKGNIELLVIVKVSLLLIDGDSGESVTSIGLGSGQDTGDKAVMKASTAAIKYAWMTTLNISTGDDPEADAGVDERTAGASKTPQQPKNEPPELVPKKETPVNWVEFWKLAENLGFSKEDVLHVANASDISKYTKDQCIALYGLLKQKKAQLDEISGQLNLVP